MRHAMALGVSVVGKAMRLGPVAPCPEAPWHWAQLREKNKVPADGSPDSTLMKYPRSPLSNGFWSSGYTGGGCAIDIFAMAMPFIGMPGKVLPPLGAAPGGGLPQH